MYLVQKVENLEKLIKNEDLNFIYLLYGEETYLIENIVKKIKTKFGEIIAGINYISLDDTNVQNIITEMEMPAFGYEKKLIIIKNSNIFKKEAKKKTAKNDELPEKICNYIENNIKRYNNTANYIINQFFLRNQNN